ncbi:serine hydrolase [Lacticaseibacillus daqingensis]|uniref:serine hydrolase n=1 Tax=Lacticaseibacillus daqingensis TaxID=2486014 RepID=UPI001CDB9F79|nr:serine hydrolase [Lacticaseibacillus daqingensis]
MAVMILVLMVTGAVWGVTSLFARDPAQSDTAADAASATSDHQSVNQVTHHQPAAKKGPALSVAAVAKQQATRKNRLNAYLKDLAASSDVAVSFYNLTPAAGSAAAKASDAAVFANGALATNVNGNTARMSASTYKLFISAYLFHAVETGTKTWTSADQASFDGMIVNSENEYAEAQLAKYGPVTLNAYYQSLGFGDVFGHGAAQTTANDLVGLLKRLANAQAPFDSPTYRQMLLANMAKQVYRDGIPAAVDALTPGAVVQDKVGWYGTTNNDAGIVTLPNGQRYLLAIMTNGAGYQDFSMVQTIAKKVQQLVYGD